MESVPTWDYEPGTVAAIRCANAHGDFHAVGEFRAVKDEKGWSSLLPEIGWVSNADVVEVRPLVVLDPDDREAAVALLAAYGRQYTDWTPSTDGPNIDRLQQALRSLTRPPRIPEPGLYAVVDSITTGGDGPRRFVRIDLGNNCWMDMNGGNRSPWSFLASPVLVREGLS